MQLSNDVYYGVIQVWRVTFPVITGMVVHFARITVFGKNSVRSEAQVKSIWACVTLPQRYHFFLGLVPGLRCHLSTRLRWIGIQYPKLIASDASLQTPKEKQTIHQWLRDTIHSLNSWVNQIQKFPSVMDHFDDVMQNQQFLSFLFFYTNNKHLHWSMHHITFSALSKG